jgi:hypothetical protein
MSLIGLIIILAVVGLLLWLLTTYVPMDPTIKKVIVAVVVIVVVLWLLSALGVLGAVDQVRVPRLR